MTLTPEERQRIYEEERVRRGAQQQIRMEEIRNTKPPSTGCLVVATILAFLFMALLMSRCSR